MPSHEIVFSMFPGSNFLDLMPRQYGRELCESGHSFGPARRQHYLFHYIISGKGTLIANDETGDRCRYELSAGEGFLIFPGQVNTDFADIDDPWEYIWVEFDGVVAADELEHCGLSAAMPIYRSASPELSDRMLDEMRYLVEHRDAPALQLVGHTYCFFDYFLRSVDNPGLSVSNKLQEFYITQAISFIEHNYQSDITVEDIAEQTGLNRSYFGKVFKHIAGKSPQQYLIAFRMKKAAELLKLTALSIADVGRAVGYPNQLHFSRAFKNVYGISPRTWRQENITR